MKLSTKGRYGLRAMLDLAESGQDGGLVPINHIADRQGVSVSYLEHLFSQLRKAGLIRSVKGAQGGYALARSTDRMCVGDVLRALEGDLSITDDQPEIDRKEDAMTQCIRQMIWEPVNARINHIVDGITLEELSERQRMLKGLTSPMYYI